jgi:hypothetical protein
MCVSLDATAAIWGALDPATGIIYLYLEHFDRNVDADENVSAIKAPGAWIPGVIDPGGLGATETDRRRMSEIYRKLGLDLWLAADAVESGVQETRQLLLTHKLKVFANLTNLLAEYRTHQRDANGRLFRGKEKLLACCHALILSGRGRMCTKPLPYVPSPSYRAGDRSWMH